VLLWGFVVAAIVAVRHDVFGVKSPKSAPAAARGATAGAVTAATPAAAAAAPALTPKQARRRKAPTIATQLAVVEGPSAGKSVALSSLPVTIGRSDSSSIVLADDYVSSNHARLVPRGTDWLVEDTGSTNGTFVNDKKVTTSTVVPVGGRIKIGRNVLELRG
jgi:pSer/pThr/pTyr-binding forkhead associated (FHA) protein